MELPTNEQCELYFEQYHVPSNIKLHCHTVNKLAVFIATKLKEQGEEVDLDVVDRLSLLHDIFKAIVIRPLKEEPKFKCNPTEEQIKFWEDMQKKYPQMHETTLFCAIFQNDFPEFCTLMKSYGEHDMLTSAKRREEQIVHYADWRVFVDEIIPLKQRIDDLFIRYEAKIMNSGKELWDKRVTDEFAVEGDICDKINIRPEDLREIIQ
jgi:hypothetical protein